MNENQRNAIKVLQQRLRSDRNITVPLPDRGESNGYVFTEVGGVTVMIGLRGSYKLPAIRSYENPSLKAAVDARVLWEKQKERDDSDPAKARDRRTGHLSPIVNTDLRCGNKDCRCRSEDGVDLQTRSLG